jgi:isochorismate hydrolase
MILIRDTWNTDIVPQLAPQHAGDVVIYKHCFSGFYQTDLHAKLKSLRVRSNHAASILVIQALFGWVSESAAFIRAVEQVPAPMATLSGE